MAGIRKSSDNAVSMNSYRDADVNFGLSFVFDHYSLDTVVVDVPATFASVWECKSDIKINDSSNADYAGVNIAWSNDDGTIHARMPRDEFIKWADALGRIARAIKRADAAK